MGKTIFLNVLYVEGRKEKEREFEIIIVPNKFNVKYHEYMQKIQKILQLNTRMEEAETEEMVQAITKELGSMNLQEVLNLKMELVNIIMIANDHEFDREWWEDRVEPNSVNAFINDCALKDVITDGKKKVLLKLVGL